MGYQDSGEVLMRGRNVENKVNTQPEKAGDAPKKSSGADHFTAHNSEFDHRRTELRKMMARDRAAAESELARLSKRCDVLKEFLFECDSSSENLENLGAIINAEKEFASRLEQLEIRYYRAFGKYSDNPVQNGGDSSKGNDPVVRVQNTGNFKNALPLVAAILFAALIIAAAMAVIFL